VTEVCKAVEITSDYMNHTLTNDPLLGMVHGKGIHWCSDVLWWGGSTLIAFMLPASELMKAVSGLLQDSFFLLRWLGKHNSFALVRMLLWCVLVPGL
jgi:hypothetical protein